MKQFLNHGFQCPACVVVWIKLLSHRVQSPALCDSCSFLLTDELRVWFSIFIFIFLRYGGLSSVALVDVALTL